MLRGKELDKEEGELPEQPFVAYLDEDRIVAEASDLSVTYLARGYGEKDEKTGKIILHPCEALYLLQRERVHIMTVSNESVSFNQLVKILEKSNVNIWTDYVVFQDLRRRGYVVKEGFGPEFRFRVFERGSYETDTARFLIMLIIEGRNVDVETIKHLVGVSRGLKKKLILSVVDRRNEVVYYLSSLVDLINV